MLSSLYYVWHMPITPATEKAKSGGPLKLINLAPPGQPPPLNERSHFNKTMGCDLNYCNELYNRVSVYFRLVYNFLNLRGTLSF